MTLEKVPAKSNCKVPQFHASLYAGWRAHVLTAHVLHEGNPSPPPERLLQTVWHHQRLRRDQLQLQDGRRLQVLHPGFWNREAGPDFRGAVLQFDAEPPCSGDVEIDLRPGDWHGHGHDHNPAFKQVLLHVVWEGAGSAAPPTLALKPVLDAPLGELGEWLGSEAARQTPATMAGRCTPSLKDLPAETLDELLRQAALCRLRFKASQLQARARQAGWEQALLEGLFRALGYKQNVWPMQRLAEVVAGQSAREGTEPAAALLWQARLLGVAGLLPAELPRSSAGPGGYLRQVWDLWWRERDQFADHVIPHAAWHFHNLRPANHPQRRLALAAHWLANPNLFARLEQWFMADLPQRRLAGSLRDALQAPADRFWSWHWTLSSARMRRPQPLLGATRVTDLVVNVILPWFWVRALAGNNETLRQAAEARYFAWPAAEDNAALRLARQRLLGGAARRSLGTAARQQGLLQVVRDFCDHSNATCEPCPFPDFLRPFTQIRQGFPSNPNPSSIG